MVGSRTDVSQCDPTVKLLKMMGVIPVAVAAAVVGAVGSANITPC